MAKSQKRSNREIRKPKAEKPKGPSAQAAEKSGVQRSFDTARKK